MSAPVGHADRAPHPAGQPAPTAATHGDGALDPEAGSDAGGDADSSPASPEAELGGAAPASAGDPTLSPTPSEALTGGAPAASGDMVYWWQAPSLLTGGMWSLMHGPAVSVLVVADFDAAGEAARATIAEALNRCDDAPPAADLASAYEEIDRLGREGQRLAAEVARLTASEADIRHHAEFARGKAAMLLAHDEAADLRAQNAALCEAVQAMARACAP